MEASKVKEALEVAERFVKLSKVILAADVAADRDYISRSVKELNKFVYKETPLSGTRKSGELKRVSLDLSQRLVELRKY